MYQALMGIRGEMGEVHLSFSTMSILEMDHHDSLLSSEIYRDAGFLDKSISICLCIHDGKRAKHGA